jgi:hypothetical protein
MKTADGGVRWQEISPDLTNYAEKDPNAKRDPDAPAPPSITALAPSPIKAGEIWVGTSNRLVWVRRGSGADWQNVSPTDMGDNAQVFYVEASHHDPATAYLTVGGMREATPPYVARTHDYGQSWQKIVTGFPANRMVTVVREDPTRKGLLYAGTSTGIFISWDDGDHWQPFSLNLPATPITDMQVHGNDLVISTFGRSLWILDDLTPVRNMSAQVAAADVFLFAPASSMRVRWDNYQDTPYPRETPAGQNPPDGAILDYFLKNAATSELTLTIYDDKGAEITKYSSNSKPVVLPPANVPSFWFASPTALTTAAGVNRFVWDLRYPAPLTLPYGYTGTLLDYTEYTLTDHAIAGQTPSQQPMGPLVLPGKYTVELRHGSQTLRQPLTVELDPRVRATQEDLLSQRDLALDIVRGMKSTYNGFEQAAALRTALENAQKEWTGSEFKKVKEAAAALEKKIDAVQTGSKTAPGLGPVNRDLARLIFSVESADMRPAETVRASVQQSCGALDKVLVMWKQLNDQEIPTFNAAFEGVRASLPVVPVNPAGCRP